MSSLVQGCTSRIKTHQINTMSQQVEVVRLGHDHFHNNKFKTHQYSISTGGSGSA